MPSEDALGDDVRAVLGRCCVTVLRRSVTGRLHPAGHAELDAADVDALILKLTVARSEMKAAADRPDDAADVGAR